MTDGTPRARFSPTDLVFVPLAFVTTLLWSHWDNGDWNWASALFSGVLLGGAAILGQRHGRKRL